MAAKPRGGDQRSPHIEAHADLVLSLRAQQPTLTLSALCTLLAERGIATSQSGLLRFFKRHRIAHKTRSRPPSSSDRT